MTPICTLLNNRRLYAYIIVTGTPIDKQVTHRSGKPRCRPYGRHKENISLASRAGRNSLCIHSGPRESIYIEQMYVIEEFMLARPASENENATIFLHKYG